MLSRAAWLVMVLFAPAAFATGEKITLVTPASKGLEAPKQLSESLCVSMDCVPRDGLVSKQGKPDFKKIAKSGLVNVVTAKKVKVKKVWKVEIVVYDAKGKKKLTHKAPASPGGRLTVPDLATASAVVMGAIEKPTKDKEKRDKE